MEIIWPRLAPIFQSVLRIVAAATFITHGTQKLFAFPNSVMPSGGTVPLTNIAGIGGLLEVTLGPLLLLGLFTRPIAFLLSGEMAVAYFRAHFPRGLYPIMNGGESALLFCFIWLFISAAGGGPLSLDALRSKSKV